MALKAWVTIPTPSLKASRAAASLAALWPRLTTTPRRRRFRDHLGGPLQLRRQGHQGDVGLRAALEAIDAFLQGRQAGSAKVVLGMGAAALRRQEGSLQVGPQQPATPGPVQGPRLGEHRQGLPQRLHPAGDQRGADRLHPIPPEQLQQGLQPGQVGRR